MRQFKIRQTDKDWWVQAYTDQMYIFDLYGPYSSEKRAKGDAEHFNGHEWPQAGHPSYFGRIKEKLYTDDIIH